MSPQGLVTMRCAVVSWRSPGGQVDCAWLAAGQGPGTVRGPESRPQAPHSDGLGWRSLLPQATQRGNQGPGRAAGAVCHCVTLQAGRTGLKQPRSAEGLPPLLGPPSPISLSWPQGGQLPSAFSISSCETVDGRAWGWGGAGRAAGDIPGRAEAALVSNSGQGMPRAGSSLACPEHGPSATAGPRLDSRGLPVPVGRPRGPSSAVRIIGIGGKGPLLKCSGLYPKQQPRWASGRLVGGMSCALGLRSFPPPWVMAATQRPWPRAHGAGCHTSAIARGPSPRGAQGRLLHCKPSRQPCLELPPLLRGCGRRWLK